MRTADGARRPASGTPRRSSEWLALTPIERAAALPELRKVVLTDKGTLARSRRARPRPSRITKRMPAASPMLIGELLRIQNGARLAADMAAGLRAGQAFAERLHPAPSAPPASPTSTT